MEFNKENYLAHFDQFQLGNLTTESIREESKNLSEVLMSSIPNAVDILKGIDKKSLEILQSKAAEVYQLQQRAAKVLAAGDKVFISGCGATGRLALSLEKVYREITGKDQVIGFMAGGDYALIKSIERFEDNTEYGRRQLHELGYREDDLVIGVTEGGETSFVIGTVLEGEAAFVYCNPDEELLPLLRSRKVLESDNIQKLNLTVGAMAISGSTRMQATTVQMIAVGFAILYNHKTFASFESEFTTFIDDLIQLDIGFISKFIAVENQIYENKGLVTYIAPGDLAMAILTDTTERSPTFNLKGFEKLGEPHKAMAYLAVKDIRDTKTAWRELLGRNPRCLSWSDLDIQINKDELFKFDISENAIERRANGQNHECFEVTLENDRIYFRLGELEGHSDLKGRDLLFQHLALKLVLNIHSTLVMGKRGRFKGNLMTFVKPSNLKLVNRAYRYITYFLDEKEIEYDRQEIIEEIFSYKENDDCPVVLEVLKKLGFFT